MPTLIIYLSKPYSRVYFFIKSQLILTIFIFLAVCRDSDRQIKTDFHPQAEDSEWETQEEDDDGWTLEDVEFELVEQSMDKDSQDKEQPDHKNEASAAAAPDTASDKLAFFEPEARVLLNLIKLSESGSRWKTSNTSRKAVSLIEMPRSEEKAASRRRARYERCSSMLEKLQSCLNRAEAKSSAAALESVKQLEGNYN